MRKKLSTLFVALVATTALWAEDFSVDGIYYQIIADKTNEVWVTFRGSDWNSYTNEYSGSVTIPSVVTYNGTTYSVTTIGRAAFYNCSKLTSVTIPNSVTQIGGSAFESCSGLTSVTIPNSVTLIGNSAFKRCSGLIYATILPNSVTTFGTNVFYGCSSLTSVVWNIKNGIEFSSSSEAPFYMGESQITSFIFGENVQHIPSYLCHGMSKLTSITIPNSVTTIGNFAFGLCKGLTSVNCLAEVPPFLSGTAFSYKSIPVYVPCGKVATYKATSGWKSFSYIQEPLAEYSISVYSNNETMGYAIVDKNSICGAQISATPNYGYHFVKWSDGNTDNPRTLTLTQNTTFTAEFAQAYSGQCGDNLYWSFDNNTLTITGSGAMWDEYPWGLFDARLTSVVWNAKNCADFSSASEAPFSDSRSQITSFTFGESVQHIPAYLCYQMSKLTSVTIPNSVTSIGDDAFYNCSGLTSPVYNAHCFVYMPSSYKGVYVIPEGIKQIEGYAFYNCSGLTSVTIPNSVTLIEYSAFEGCSGLTSITIPNSVKGIESGAFKGCSGLTSIVWNTKNWNDNYSNPFNNIRSQITSFTIGDNVQYIPAYLCQGMSKLTSITIPNSVTTIGGWAFQSCSGLTSVTIGNSVTTIGDEAFYGCSSLTSVSIGNSVKIIRESAFASCSSLTSITIPNSVTNIKSGVFANCNSLEEVSLGYGMEYIGGEAFAGCNRLYDIYCYATNPPEIKESSFANYNAKLYVPCESKEDYEYDLVWGNFKFIECIDLESAVDEIPTAPTNMQKIFRDNQLLIIRDGKTYNVMGQEIGN